VPAPANRHRRGWALILSSLKPYRWSIAIGVAAGLVWTACKVLIPTVVGRAIDEGILANHHDALLRWALILLGIGLVSATCTGVRRYFAFAVSWRVEADVRERLYAHLQRLHFAFHDQAQTGQLMSRAATDLQQIQSLVTMVPITISNIATVVAVTVVLLLIDVKLTLLALGALPFLNVAAKRFSSRIHPASVELQQELAELATVVEETVTGIRAVKGFGAEAIQAERMRQQTSDVFAVSMRAARIRSVFWPILDFLPALGMVAVLWYGGHQVLSGQLTVGQLVEFNYYVVILIVPLRMIGMLVAQAQRAVASGARIDEILATDPAIVDRPGARRLPADSASDAAQPQRTPAQAGLGALRFQAVRFGYHPARPVLDGFDLEVAPGEAVALVGPTASGKTTVARLIPRFYDVDTGSVRIDGIDVRDLRLHNLRQAVGIVFEDTFLFSDTIRANISFGNPSAPTDHVEWAARLAGAHEFIVDLPDGYDTEIGERGFSLSGGQRQRLALARAILADPRVLILDDATSSVDPTKEHEIRAALSEVMRGRTTIVIAHRSATIALADRVVLLDQGRVIAEGTHADLLANNERYREVLAKAERDSRDSKAHV
jgi:ATP-binding cassette subfamily B protein